MDQKFKMYFVFFVLILFNGAQKDLQCLDCFIRDYTFTIRNTQNIDSSQIFWLVAHIYIYIYIYILEFTAKMFEISKIEYVKHKNCIIMLQFFFSKIQ